MNDNYHRLFSNEQNCQTMNCTKFKCLVQAVGFSKQIRLFRLTGSIDLAILDSIFNVFSPSNFSHLRLRNDLKLVLPDALLDVYQEMDDSHFDDPSILSATHSVYLTIRQIPGRERLAFWIIVSSILAGMFILSLLVVSLVKVGGLHVTNIHLTSNIPVERLDSLEDLY